MTLKLNSRDSGRYRDLLYILTGKKALPPGQPESILERLYDILGPAIREEMREPERPAGYYEALHPDHVLISIRLRRGDRFYLVSWHSGSGWVGIPAARKIDSSALSQLEMVIDVVSGLAAPGSTLGLRQVFAALDRDIRAKGSATLTFGFDADNWRSISHVEVARDTLLAGIIHEGAGDCANCLGDWCPRCQKSPDRPVVAPAGSRG